MNLMKSIVVLGLASTALMANDAVAEECDGYVISRPLKPILMGKAPDGSTTHWFSSEGIFIVRKPENHPANRVNRICGGGFKIAADGKSGLGVGSCIYTGLNGDVFHLRWQTTFVQGTWEITGGTGKFKGFSGQGTFQPTKRFANTWGSTTWKGECNLPQ